MKLDSEKPELKSRTKDLTGCVFQALTVLSFAGYGDNQSGGKAMWTCQCSCGRSVVLRANALTSGNTKSCGCLRFVDKPYKHKAAGTKAHTSWRAIKGRCYNENNIQYKDYGGRGIKMEDCFREDFLSFFAEVGDPPDDGRRWTIDRIDNDLGYIKGNIRWALPEQQARNKGKSSRCKTGVTGVHRVVFQSGFEYYCANWVEGHGEKKVQHQKLFSIRKLGEEIAFDMAVKYREEKIKIQKKDGFDYSEKHGK